MLQPTIFPSPNKKYKVVLKPLGEIQPGTNSYSLSIDGFVPLFDDRIFGQVCLWSHDSRFLAIQEWKQTHEDGPARNCLLLLIDLSARRECVVASVDGSKSNILPEGFMGESLNYTVIYDGQFGITKNFESKFQYLDNWQTLK